MTITMKKADLFSLNVEALVNTVNCVGVMGKGVALQFKTKYYNDVFLPYQKDCAIGLYKPGTCTMLKLPDNLIVLMFATKDHWRNNSSIDWIDSGLADMRYFIKENNIKSVGMTWPGCGNGGLDRKDVEPLLLTHLLDLDCEITICG